MTEVCFFLKSAHHSVTLGITKELTICCPRQQWYCNKGIVRCSTVKDNHEQFEFFYLKTKKISKIQSRSHEIVTLKSPYWKSISSVCLQTPVMQAQRLIGDSLATSGYWGKMCTPRLVGEWWLEVLHLDSNHLLTGCGIHIVPIFLLIRRSQSV